MTFRGILNLNNKLDLDYEYPFLKKMIIQVFISMKILSFVTSFTLNNIDIYKAEKYSISKQSLIKAFFKVFYDAVLKINLNLIKLAIIYFS